MKNLFLCTAFACVAATGCAGGGRQKEPVMASSADATSYAVRYPDALEGATQQLAADKAEAARITSTLSTRGSELKGDPELLLEIIEAADEAGRGEAYGEAAREANVVRHFMDEERGPIGSRINGSAQKQLAEGGCQNADIGGSISYALKDGVDKQLEKRLRANNEAHLLIERNKASLGNGNAQSLQKLADEIALASYLVNVALIQEKNRVDHLIGEKRSIERTLEDSIEDERKFQAEKAKNDADKRTSEQRIAELQKSKDGLAATVERAEAETKDLDTQIEQARKDYDAALDGLKKSLETDDPERGMVSSRT